MKYSFFFAGVELNEDDAYYEVFGWTSRYMY